MGIRLDVTAVGLVAVIAGAGIGAWQEQQPKVYGASSQLVLQPAPSTLAIAGARPDNLVFLAHTYAAHFRARPTLQAAIDKSGLSITPTQALHRTSVTVSTVDSTMTVSTTGPTKADARALNEALDQVVTDEIRSEADSLRTERLAPLDTEISDLQRQIEQAPAGSIERSTAQQTYETLVASRAQTLTQPSDQVDVLSPSQAESSPVAPHPARDALITFLVVLALGAQFVVWRAVRRRSVTSGIDALALAPTAVTPAPVTSAPVTSAPVMPVAGTPAPSAPVVEESAITRMARRPSSAKTHAPRKPSTPRTTRTRSAKVDGVEIAESS